MARLIAAAVDITATEPALEVVLVSSSGSLDGYVDIARGRGCHVGVTDIGVPLQAFGGFIVLLPSQGLNLQTSQVEHQTVLDLTVGILAFLHTCRTLLVGSTNHTAVVGCVVG